MVQRRIARRAVDGVLLLDKPSGMSSNHALQAARRLFNAAKAGHTGTLDPLASGLLPLTFGEATKFSQGLLDADKCYRATARLGVTTTTGDAEGEVVRERECRVEAAQIPSVIEAFTGELSQIPPMYSALRSGGQRLYELARQGLEVPREARRVQVHELRLVSFEPPLLVFDVCCSKGTYVRTLAEDIGEALGCGAHLGALRRTAIGQIRVDRAVSLEQLEACDERLRSRLLLAMDVLVGSIPVERLDRADAEIVLHGGALRRDELPAGERRLYGPGGFIGLGRVDERGLLWPKRLVATRQGDGIE